MSDEHPKGIESLGQRLREALEGASEADRERWKERDLQFRRLGEQLSRPIEVLPFPEVEFNPDLAEQPANIRRLVELTGAAIEESRELRKAVMDSAAEQARAATWMVRLTWAIAILTALLAWEIVHFWPVPLLLAG